MHILKKNLYIIIEHKNREFLAQVLISFFAIKKNFRIYIGNYKGIFKLLSLKKKKSGILLMKGGLNEKLTKLVKQKCEKYVILDQEVSPGFEKKKYIKWILSRFYKKTIQFIDLYLCTNDDMYQELKKKTKIEPFLSGWPRVDTWRPIFKNLYIDEIQSLKKKYGKFIFFSSDFGVTCQQDFDELLERIPSNAKKKEIPSIKKRNLIYATNIFNEYKKFIIFLKKIDKNKNCPTVVIRSHPGESLTGWKNDLKNLDNINYLPPEGPIDPYIFACKGFAHRGSTTAYQAILAKKPLSFILMSSDLIKAPALASTPFHFRDDLMRSSTIIKNEDEFISWSKNPKKKFNKLLEKSIKKGLNIRKKYAAESIAERFDEFNCNKDKNIANYINESDTGEKILFLVKNFISKIFFNRKVAFHATKIKKLENGILDYEVENIIFKLKKILRLNFFKKLSIRKVSDNVVEIEKIK